MIDLINWQVFILFLQLWTYFNNIRMMPGDGRYIKTDLLAFAGKKCNTFSFALMTIMKGNK